MSTSEHGVLSVPSEEPDAVCRGWWSPPDHARDAALFMLAGTAMGVSLSDAGTGELTAPEWIDLATVVHLDAIGDPVAGLQEVELELSTGVVRRAGWTDPFCDAVVAALHLLLAGGQTGAAAPPAPPVVPVAPAPTAAPAPAPAAPTPVPSVVPPLPPVAPPAPVDLGPLPEPATSVPPLPVPPVAPVAGTDVPLPPPVPAAPVPPVAATPAEAPVVPAPEVPNAVGPALVLEDVVYLGGHPSESKKRKRCTATMGTDGVTVEGPSDLRLAMPWSAVALVEAQNSDEARFRMNLRVHRDATALVLSCHDGAKVLLEARDCPTIPLRGAIAQLLAGQPVEVA